MTASAPDNINGVSRRCRALAYLASWPLCWLAACTPLSDLDTYAEGSPPLAPTADASAAPPSDVPPEIIIGPIQPGADAAVVEDAGPELDAAPDGGACDGPGEAVGPGGQGCYRFVAVAASWNAAQIECTGWGDSLVVVTSQAEDAYLATRADGEDIWLGLSDFVAEGQLVWVDGEPFDYENWAVAQPDNFQNEDCVEKRGQDAFWNDRACVAPHAYICER